MGFSKLFDAFLSQICIIYLNESINTNPTSTFIFDKFKYLSYTVLKVLNWKIVIIFKSNWYKSKKHQNISTLLQNLTYHLHIYATLNFIILTTKWENEIIANMIILSLSFIKFYTFMNSFWFKLNLLFLPQF